MSFRWSVGDIISGLKVLYDVYASVSKAYHNAEFEASGFFEEFSEITRRLDDWKAYKETIDEKDNLAHSYLTLKKRCAAFIKEHFALIQASNPKTISEREPRSTWVRNVKFTAEQAENLFRKVTWSTHRATLAVLRAELQYVLNLATFDLGREAATFGRDNNSILRAMSQDHRQLVSSCEKLVGGVAYIINQITDPFGEVPRLRDSDSTILQQFAHTLPPPRTVQAIQAPPSENEFPWQTSHTEQVLVLAQTNRPVLEARVVDDLAERVGNVGKRMKRVETLDTTNEPGTGDSVLPSVHDLLERLRYTRGCIQDQVAVTGGSTGQSQPHDDASETEDPDTALRLELENWRRLDQQIQQDTIHNRSTGPRLRTSIQSETSSMGNRTPARSSSWASTTATAATTPRSDTSARRGSSRRHGHNGSLPALPRPAPEFLERRIPVKIDFPGMETDDVDGFIDAIVGHNEGFASSISAISGDRATTIRHFVAPFNPESTVTPFIPYLDNCHITGHSWRVQFQGWHSLHVEKDGISTPKELQYSPNYQFTNVEDFKNFQTLLLGKHIQCSVDTKEISSTDGVEQCHRENLRILFDPQKQTKHILYFKKATKEGITEHVEWPVSLFTPPAKPPELLPTKKEKDKHRTLELSSLDGKPLAKSRRLSRKNTGTSLSPSSPTDSSHKSSNDTTKGLKIEFYNYNDCLAFWTAFTAANGTVDFAPTVDWNTSREGPSEDVPFSHRK